MTVERKAEEARQVLENPLVRDFFKEAEGRIMSAMMATPFNDKDGREDLANRAYWLGQFKGWFEMFIQNGELGEMKSEQSKLRRLFRGRT